MKTYCVFYCLEFTAEETIGLLAVITSDLPARNQHDNGKHIITTNAATLTEIYAV